MAPRSDISSMYMVVIGRLVQTSREHIIPTDRRANYVSKTLFARFEQSRYRPRGCAVDIRRIRQPQYW
jgi:hypothetical protein